VAALLEDRMSLSPRRGNLPNKRAKQTNKELTLENFCVSWCQLGGASCKFAIFYVNG